MLQPLLQAWCPEMPPPDPREFLRFKRKPAKQGDFYSFFIPKVYVDNGLIDPNEEYYVYVKLAREVDREGNEME